MNEIPRPEYPRPQFARDEWMNLNGTWQFEIDYGVSGRERGLVDAETLSGTICVPFCPESKLSGVEHKDFMNCVWYKRSFTLPDAVEGKRVILHFGAVDYRCEVWVNGRSVGSHQGGYVSFSFEITQALKAGDNVITVCAEDDNRHGLQPRGKQAGTYHSVGCDYTRTTGIWQTVWLEWVNEAYIQKVRLTPDAANGMIYIDAQIAGSAARISAEASYQGRFMGKTDATVMSSSVRLAVALAEKHLWNVGDPKLYDLTLTLTGAGREEDKLSCYFGLRDIFFDGMRFLMNGKPVFQRLVLDQGFFPDGIYTAPTDEALRADIERAQKMGFNGARLHEKVFEARYLYWADHMGYLCWGEMANWGLDTSKWEILPAFLKEWLEALERDVSAPSIVGWCPFNEVWDIGNRIPGQETLKCVYLATKAYDPTRPVIDSSGGIHDLTDVYDMHNYDQDPETFREHYGPGSKPIFETDYVKAHETYGGQPVFVSEYGGIWWKPDGEGWGYGARPNSPEGFIARYKGLTDALLDNPDHFGFCYTQLTDIEQEVNGLYTYDRVPKFDPQIFYRINTRKAACEEE